MTAIVRSSAPRAEIGVAILRIMLGIVFLAHGYQKLFIFGHAGVAGAFTQMGVPMPGVSSAIVTAVEFVGGIALIVGFVTSGAASLVGIEMLGAILLVHGRNGFFLPNGAEFALTLLAASIAVILAGPGAFAIDNVLAARRGTTAGATPAGGGA